MNRSIDGHRVGRRALRHGAGQVPSEDDDDGMMALFVIVFLMMMIMMVRLAGAVHLQRSI